MGLGIRGQLRHLRSLLDPSNRYTDIAVRFEIHERVGESHRPTGVYSPVYGGRWDSWKATLLATPPDLDVLTLPVTEKQFEYVTIDTPRLEGNGGRGSGKSEGGSHRCVRFICERPGENGQIVSPVHEQTLEIWDVILRLIPRRWLKPGSQGIIRGQRPKLLFRHGVSVRFRSGKYPDNLRSWGGGWCLIDEEQDILEAVIGVVWPSLRNSSNPCMWRSGTPKPGVYQRRHRKMEALAKEGKAVILHFDSWSNCFVSHAAFRRARDEMDERMYRQEIGAEWVFTDDANLVCYGFDRETHCLSEIPKDWKDITAQVTRQRCGVSRAFIAGADYNGDYPNYAVLYKVFFPRIWVAMAVVSHKGHAGHLGRRMKQLGYAAKDTQHKKDVLVIADASGRYNHGPKSSSRLMRAERYTVREHRKNPLVVNRINAHNVKVSPVDGKPTWYMLYPQCEELAECLENLAMAANGKNLDKTGKLNLDKSGDDITHVYDGATYPLEYFDPAAWDQVPRLRAV